MAVRSVIFDFDGTLAESMGAWRNLEGRLCAMVGIEDTSEVMEELCPLTIPEVAAYFHEGYGLKDTNKEVIELMNEIMADEYANNVPAKPGANALVRELASRRIPMAVVSSTPHHLLDIGLAALGMADDIKVVVSVDDVGHSKREPHAFNEATRLMGGEVATTMVFEDSLYAINTANDAGYMTFGVHDQDESGTMEQLKNAADVAYESLEGLDVEAVLTTAL